MIRWLNEGVYVCAAKLIYFNFYLYQFIYKDKSQGNFKISIWSLGLVGVGDKNTSLELNYRPALIR